MQDARGETGPRCISRTGDLNVHIRASQRQKLVIRRWPNFRHGVRVSANALVLIAVM